MQQRLNQVRGSIAPSIKRPLRRGLKLRIQRLDRRSGRSSRTLKRAALIFPLFLCVTALAVFVWLYSSLPTTRGSLAVSGIGTPVEITRDAHGIPTITASSQHDAIFGLGFLHAQDRLFQMDLRRRLGAGRLSEVMGATALTTDKWMRTLGLYRLASASLAHQSDSFQMALVAYAEGVNSYLAARRGALPPEFTLLGYSPEPWQPADTLVLGKLLQLELSGNFRRELLKANLIKTLPPDAIQELFSNHPKYDPTVLSRLSELYRRVPVGEMLAGVPREVGPVYASNSWVVDGRHTDSGKPLLANDPHLGLGAPGVWYLCRIEAPGLTLSGATIAGAPLVVLGHNREIAWGFTATIADVEDLFVEQIDPADSRRYLGPNGSHPFGVRSETIAVRAAPPATIDVRSTHHGPVVSDAAAGMTAIISRSNHVFALAATFLTSDDRSMEAIWNIGQAADWSSFTGALKLFRGPQQTMVYADTKGNIGYYAPGAIPIRRAGDGTLPVPGWTGEFDWTGLIPFDDLPHAFNPASGKFVSANQDIVPDGYPYIITHDWATPYRSDRIKALLAARPKHSIDTFALIMADDLSLSVAAVLPRLLRVKASGDMAQRALQLLERWDHRMDYQRPEPLIVTAWLVELNRLMFAASLGGRLSEYQSIHPIRIDAILARLPPQCETRAAGESPSGESPCRLDAAAALETALSRLAARFGTDLTKWRWGDAHHAYFSNPFFSRFSFLHDFTNPSIASSGGNDTVNVGTSRLANTNSPFAHVEGAGLRAIYDLADLERSVFMVAPGQSGNVLSGNYRDLLKPWRDFKWFTLQKADRGDRLVLAPAQQETDR